MTTRAFGLALDLPLHLEDVGTTRLHVPVSFHTRPLPRHQPSWLVTSSDALTVGWQDYGEFAVTGPPTPAIRATLAGTTPENASLAIVLSVLPLCLSSFGLEPLHGSAVTIDGDLVLLLGPTHAGKTTTAAHLLARGHSLAADDACALDADGQLWPGPPLLGIRDPRLVDLVPGRVIGPYDEKTVLAPGHCTTDPQTVAAVVILEPEPGGTGDLRTLTSRDALKALLAQVRAPRALAVDRRQLQLDVVALLAAGPVASASFDKTKHDGACVANAIETWVKALRTNAVARTATGQ